MSVDLEPAELGFKRPFTHEVSQVLRLHNPHSQPVAFKVKTTAPKQYCVRPNSGRIDSSSSVEVQVLLQAMKEDPPPDAKCRDKFLVQSVIIPGDANASNVAQVWSAVEATSKSAIQERKIRVNFLPADGQVNGVAGAHHEEDHPPAYASSPAAATPQRRAVDGDDRSPGGIDQSMASVHSASESASNTVSSAAAAVTSAIPTSSEDVKRQLEDAKATIARLQTQASEGLRQRKIGADSGAADSKSGSGSGNLGMQNQPLPGGVPVQIVAGLCLLCFLLAYLFF